jgi:hypothetical protein
MARISKQITLDMTEMKLVRYGIFSILIVEEVPYVQVQVYVIQYC